MHLNLIDKFSESEQLASMETNIHKGSGNNFPVLDTENTLSNVTSIQSHLQSLYDCNDSNKNGFKYNNHNKNINKISSNEKLLKMHASNNINESNSNLYKSFEDGVPVSVGIGVGVGGSNNIKMTLETQHHQKNNQNPDLETKTKTMLSELKRNLSPQLKAKTYVTKEQQQITDYAVASDNPKSSGLNNAKTATILVSKSKTKTGLPLLLKNSIN